MGVSTPQGLARLNEAIKDRAEQPGWSLRRIATEAGIDVQTLYAIRNGKNRPSRRTARGLDGPLGWEEGSTLAVLDGGEPTPRVTQVSGEDPYEARIMALENLPEETKLAMIKRMRENKAAIERQIVEEAEIRDRLAQVEQDTA